MLKEKIKNIDSSIKLTIKTYIDKLFLDIQLNNDTAKENTTKKDILNDLTRALDLFLYPNTLDFTKDNSKLIFTKIISLNFAHNKTKEIIDIVKIFIQPVFLIDKDSDCTNYDIRLNILNHLKAQFEGNLSFIEYLNKVKLENFSDSKDKIKKIQLDDNINAWEQIEKESFDELKFLFHKEDEKKEGGESKTNKFSYENYYIDNLRHISCNFTKLTNLQFSFLLLLELLKKNDRYISIFFFLAQDGVFTGVDNQVKIFQSCGLNTFNINKFARYIDNYTIRQLFEVFPEIDRKKIFDELIESKLPKLANGLIQSKFPEDAEWQAAYPYPHIDDAIKLLKKFPETMRKEVFDMLDLYADHNHDFSPRTIGLMLSRIGSIKISFRYKRTTIEERFDILKAFHTIKKNNVITEKFGFYIICNLLLSIPIETRNETISQLETLKIEGPITLSLDHIVEVLKLFPNKYDKILNFLNQEEIADKDTRLEMIKLFPNEYKEIFDLLKTLEGEKAEILTSHPPLNLLKIFPETNRQEVLIFLSKLDIDKINILSSDHFCNLLRKFSAKDLISIFNDLQTIDITKLNFLLTETDSDAKNLLQIFPDNPKNDSIEVWNFVKNINELKLKIMEDWDKHRSHNSFLNTKIIKHYKDLLDFLPHDERIEIFNLLEKINFEDRGCFVYYSKFLIEKLLIKDRRESLNLLSDFNFTEYKESLSFEIPNFLNLFDIDCRIKIFSSMKDFDENKIHVLYEYRDFFNQFHKNDKEKVFDELIKLQTDDIKIISSFKSYFPLYALPKEKRTEAFIKSIEDKTFDRSYIGAIYEFIVNIFKTFIEMVQGQLIRPIFNLISVNNATEEMKTL